MTLRMERDRGMVEEWILKEYEGTELDQSDFDDDTAEILLNRYSPQIEVDFPTPKTGFKWVLKNQGYVGYIALPDDKAVVLEPKVKLENVFAMLEYAYNLGEFDLSTVYDSDTVEGFYDRIANILAENVIDRRRRGLFRSYVEREEQSQRIKGRIDFTKTAKKPWDPKVHIKYSEMTADNEDNQILLYTLNRISSASGVCREGTLRKARQGIRSMRRSITYNEFRASDCVGRSYNRLNRDYERLHALCRLILDISGPGYSSGDRRMVPFTVGMADLFQGFATEWLKQNLPARFRVKAEEEVPLTTFKGKDLKFRIDMVLYDRATGEPLCIIDAKYKASGRPESSDITQMVGYAESKDTSETFLLYPEPLDESFDVEIGDIRVRSTTFSLDGDLDSNGRTFLRELADQLDEPNLIPV